MAEPQQENKKQEGRGAQREGIAQREGRGPREGGGAILHRGSYGQQSRQRGCQLEVFRVVDIVSCRARQLELSA